jgi:hypothetical protein
MKIALCFIISYDHILNKEDIWREWIQINKDIINVYFYYGNYEKITSPWIQKHAIPSNYIYPTSYYHVIPAYISLMKYAIYHDNTNQWFCFLTDSCCPIISPLKFRQLFYSYYNKSIISWKPSWWNVDYHKRANLALLDKKYHLANDPWFVLKKENVNHVLQFINLNKKITQIVCSGGLANESLFAIVLESFEQLTPSSVVISSVTHLTDWSRMTSSTSPHLFKEANERDIMFIDESLEKYPYVMFIRKISPEFPDEILNFYIYELNREKIKTIGIKEPIIFKYNRFKNSFIFVIDIIFYYLFYILISYCFYKLLLII